MAKIRLGIDMGAVFVKSVMLDESGRVQQRRMDRHHGDPARSVREHLEWLQISEPFLLGVTGTMGHLLANSLGFRPVDFVQAEIRVVRQHFPEVRNIINVGGGSVTLIQLDEEGNFLDYNTNSLCAAGTGSFLDQQADRLGIRYEELGSFTHHEDPPSIATRCSVFAKSDLVHRQQEGFSKSALWCGLCKGMTATFLNTLLRGRPLRGLTIITGGVSQNREVMRWLRARYHDQVKTFADAPYCSAIGAALLADKLVSGTTVVTAALRGAAPRAVTTLRRPPLGFRKTKYPSFAVAEAYTDDDNNEVRITRWPNGPRVRCHMGIDVGSTSTKLVLLDEEEQVICDVYRKTAGAPLEATKLLFRALQDICRRKHAELQVLSVGTTGSGRKLVGLVVGADCIQNEITAHLTGALHFDPEVETIFEIGGQDSKYIRAKDGRICDSNMNYVCAAGTGSFVEEQAKKLGFDLDAIGDVVMGIAPPMTSDRCTVFMEQDVDRLIRAGYTREECIAAVLCSVVKNYFTKVVGRRPYSRKKIFFQGATARNKGLVAAFENLLDVKMVVSPYCHVLGAIGVALLAKRKMADAGSETKFRGLDLSQRKIVLHTEDCKLCPNHCKITFAEIEGETTRPSWGYMCGRDPEENRARIRREFIPFRRRLSLIMQKGNEPAQARGTVAIPHCLHSYSMLPLWRTFFEELGYRVVVTERTTEEIIRQGIELSAADFCFPIKIAHGHAAAALVMEDADFVFIPHLISLPHNPSASNTVLCPYVEAFPSVVKSTLRLHGVDIGRILSPVVDFACARPKLLAALHEELGSRLGVSRVAVVRAWSRAEKAQATFEAARRDLGRRLLAEVEASGERAIVVLGRPYNTLDLGANLSLPQKIADLGVRVIPLDLLPYDVRDINPVFRNMYWPYAQHILCAAEFVRRHPQLYAIYFTNFSCGPDSFILSYVEDIMGDKPFLTLEIDEHGGDAGYLTRVEAFLDVVRSWTPHSHKPYIIPAPDETPTSFGNRRLWVPPMHPVGTPLFAAALRGHGYRAEAMPPETAEVFECGRSLLRGSECLPAAVTTGGIVHTLRSQARQGGNGEALFMPTARGPCRFGQYGLLQRMILNTQGFPEVAILAPSSENAYGGLSQSLRVAAWKSILSADILWKCRCRLKPYEKHTGDVDEALAAGLRDLAQALESGREVEPVLKACVERFARIPVAAVGSKPLVGIVGEIYVRCNAFCNDHLVEAIEREGGEAWVAPLGEWILYTAFVHRHAAGKRFLNIGEKCEAFLKNKFLTNQERRFYDLVGPLLAGRHEPDIREIIEVGAKRVPREFYGEAILTLGRAELFARQGASLVVNVAPFGCMPGTIASALSREIQAETRVPIVNIFYDGEAGLNERLSVFFHNLAASRGVLASSADPVRASSAAFP